MYLQRTCFKNEIIAEFLPPTRPSQKVIIFCAGMPGLPSKKELLFFFAKKGYWVFLPRYRGTWESGGEFLKKSPHNDVLDIIEILPKGFTSLWDGKKHIVNPKKLYLFGSSFGGTAVILSSIDQRVTKVVALSPVIDWRYPSKLQPINKLEKFTEKAFKNAYRSSTTGWRKLRKGELYNPITSIDKVDGKKILIIHSKNDEVVSYIPAKKFARLTGAELTLLKKEGHISLSNFMEKKFYLKIKKFLNK